MNESAKPGRGVVARWRQIPLYLRIVAGAVFGVLLGLWLGPDAAPLQAAGGLLLRVLGALAAPLILFAVVQAILTTDVKGRTGIKLFYLLITNTLWKALSSMLPITC